MGRIGLAYAPLVKTLGLRRKIKHTPENRRITWNEATHLRIDASGHSTKFTYLEVVVTSVYTPGPSAGWARSTRFAYKFTVHLKAGSPCSEWFMVRTHLFNSL